MAFNLSALDEAKQKFNQIKQGFKIPLNPWNDIRQKVNQFLPQAPIRGQLQSSWNDIKAKADEIFSPIQQSSQQFNQRQNIQVRQNRQNVLNFGQNLWKNIDPMTTDPNAYINKAPVLGGIRQFSRDLGLNSGYEAFKKQSTGIKLTPEEKKLANEYQLNMLPIGGMGVVGKNVFKKQTLDLVRKGILSNPEVKNLIGRFAQLVEENPTGINRKNLGGLGDYVQSVGETVFGKEATNLTNIQLKNAFDAVMQEAARGKGGFKLSIGLGTQNIRDNLRKGGKNLFTNVPEIDNPLLMGKDWIKKRASETTRTVADTLDDIRISRTPKNSGFANPPVDDLVNKLSIDVRKKVNIIDYFRTPNRVLEKIGMGQEAKLLRQKYDDYLMDLPKEIDKITAWSKRVPSSSNQRIFQWLDGDKIKLNPDELNVANEIKGYLKQWAVKLKLPEEKQISNYITHLFEKGKIEKEFDPELAKIIQGKVVGSVYDPFLQRRVGKPEYLQDTWKALDAYTKRATRKFHMDVALEKVAAKAESLPLESYNYVKGRIARINMQPTDIDNLIDNAIKSSPIGYRLGQRPVTSVTQKARQMVFRGLLGLNPGTALRNLQQSTNSYAVLGEKHFGVGIGKTLLNLPRLIAGKDTELEKAGVLGKDIVQDRTYNAVHKFWEKADDTLFYQFNMAEKINRGIAYFGAKSKGLSQGMDEQKAIQYAKDVVGKTQFFYDVIDTPAALQSDLSKTLFQFAKYPLAQTEFLLEMVKNKNVAGSLRWIASNLLFVGTAGKILGLDYGDMFPQFRFQAPPTLQLPVEAAKAGFNIPNEYGQVSDEENPLKRIIGSKDVQRGITNYIPAGGQIRKSLEAVQAMDKGGSFTPSGQLRFELKPSVKTAIFGIWNTPEAKKYLDKKLKRNLSQPEQEATEFKKEEKQIDDTETKLAGQIYLKLKNLKTAEERRQLFDQLEQQGVLSDDVRKTIASLREKSKARNEGQFAKATRLINTNEGKAKFLVRLFQKKSVEERKKILEELELAGLLTKDLREKLAKAKRQ